MESNQPDLVSEWTSAIRRRLAIQREAWKGRNAASNDAVIADGFRAFCPAVTAGAIHRAWCCLAACRARARSAAFSPITQSR